MIQEIQNKTHVRDYLTEFLEKDNPEWLKLLIEKVIKKSGNIEQTDKDEIFDKLLVENNLSSEGIAKEIVEKNDDTELESKSTAIVQGLFIDSIVHRGGVNALAKNELLKFSHTCNILYGLNGTGKSGYFRILHELAGGDRAKTILSNIHSESEENFQVDIEYSIKDVAQPTLIWKDKDLRGIYPFNQVRVFDSEYLPLYLDDRECAVDVEPLGLNYFKVISNTLDEFKANLENQQIQIQTSNVDLSPLLSLIHNYELSSILRKEKLEISDKEKLNSYYGFDETMEQKLVSLRKKLVEYHSLNTADTKRIAVLEIQELKNLKQSLLTKKTSISDSSRKVNKAINDFNIAKNKRDNHKLQYEVLKDIPSKESSEWQLFIESARKYSDKIHTHSDFDSKKKCIYCQQELSESALGLVKTYTTFLSDSSQQEFKTSDGELLQQKVGLEGLNIDITIPDSISLILKNQIIDSSTLYEEIVRFGNSLSEQRKALLNNIALIESNSNEFICDISPITQKLDENIQAKQKIVDDLNLSESDKNTKMVEVSNQINQFEDSKNLSEWKTRIETNFSTKSTISIYTSAIKTINTRPITDLSTKAHEELITESIRHSFEQQLKNLGKDVGVTLEKTGAGKGSVKTKLKILGKDIPSILSEGEQKAVALALFLAEVENQHDLSPIIFDDPVTSLDQEIAHVLAKNLLLTAQTRQIIIFTHHKNFYDSLVHWASCLKDNSNKKIMHVCKNYTQSGCGDKSLHIYTYKVDRESKDKTGLLIEYQNECLRYYLDKAESDMKTSFSVSVVAGYLKSSIEHYIDEKVLNNHGLIKDQKIKDHIEWENLKISDTNSIIDKLHEYWDKLSNRGTHLTANYSENPLSREELVEIITFLKT